MNLAHQLHQQIPAQAKLAVALSGGPDSTAIAHALSQRKAKPIALIVDHGVRVGSAQEAQRVAQRARAWGLEAHILTLPPGTPATHQALRVARYQVLTQACVDLGLDGLVTGHHQDDQLETLLERLTRGSGLEGLAGLEPQRLLFPCPHAPRLWRPALDLSKAALLDYATRHGLTYESDPNNTAQRYARARWRAALPHLGPQENGLLALAQSLAALKQRQAASLDAYLDRHVRWQQGLALCLDRSALLSLEHATQRRLLAGALRLVGWCAYPPAPHALSNLLAGLSQRGDQGFTLAHCLVVSKGAEVWICRESRHLASMAQGPWYHGAPQQVSLGAFPQAMRKTIVQIAASAPHFAQRPAEDETKAHNLCLAASFRNPKAAFWLVTSAIQLKSFAKTVRR